MKQLRNNIIRAGLEALYFSGAHLLLQPSFSGVGAIFMLAGSAHALPVMREFDAPSTVYVATDFAEGTGKPWSIALKRAIAKACAIEQGIGELRARIEASTLAVKHAAFERLHQLMRSRVVAAKRNDIGFWLLALASNDECGRP
jgi:hypothetical protein